jgi:hypothetical protein
VGSPNVTSFVDVTLRDHIGDMTSELGPYGDLISVLQTTLRPTAVAASRCSSEGGVVNAGCIHAGPGESQKPS